MGSIAVSSTTIAHRYDPSTVRATHAKAIVLIGRSGSFRRADSVGGVLLHVDLSDVRTGRRRVWTLVRRSAAEGLGRFCSGCRTQHVDAPYDDERVFELCADAACALLVSDVLPASESAALTAPLRHLIPLQRAGD